MKKLVLLMLLPLVLLAGGPAHAQKKTAWMEPYLPNRGPFISEYELILQSLEKGEFAPAIAGSNACLAKESSNAACYFFRGWANAATNQYSACVGDIDQALKLSTGAASDSQVHYMRSFCQQGQGNNDAALRDINRTIALQPESADGYSARAGIYFAMKNYDRAVADYTKVISISPTSENYLVRGQAYTEVEKYDLAIADLSKSISIKRTYEGYITRANVYGLMGDTKRAAADALFLTGNFTDNNGDTRKLVDAIIAADPKIVDAWMARAQLDGNRGNNTEAIAGYTKAIEIDPNAIAPYFARALIYSKLKDYVKAVADNTKVIQLNPKANLAFYNRGNSYYELNQVDKAAEDYAAYISLVPNDEDGYYSRGRVYLKQGKHDLALADLTKAIGLDNETPSFYNTRGDILLKLNKRDEAIANYQEALVIKEDNAYAKKALKDLGAPEMGLLKDLNETFWRNETDDICFCRLIFDEDGTVLYQNDDGKKAYKFFGTYVINGHKFSAKFNSYNENTLGSIKPTSNKNDEGFQIEGEQYVSPEGKIGLKILSVVHSKYSKGRVNTGLELRSEGSYESRRKL